MAGVAQTRGVAARSSSATSEKDSSGADSALSIDPLQAF